MKSPLPTIRSVLSLAVAMLCSALAAPRAVRGQSASDSFDYPTGQILGDSKAGVGWYGPWRYSEYFKVASGNLSADGVTGTGSHVVTTTSYAAINAITRSLATAVSGAPGTTLWFSCIVQSDNDAHYGGFSVAGGTGSNVAGLFVGRSDSPNLSINWVLEDSGGGDRFSSNVAVLPGTPTLLVVRLDFTSGNTICNLFVNPALGSTPTVPDAVKDDISLGTNITDFQLTAGPAKYEMDEFRVGPTFQSVIASTARPTFFSGEASLANGVYYLSFSNGDYFGYYSYLNDPRYLYHFDLGYEYLFDANDGKGGVYLYDFASSTFFYTSPSFPFPYLYDFSRSAVLYYYANTASAGHYTTNPRYFYDYSAGAIITK